MAKVTFVTIPNPADDPSGFVTAVNANLATLAAAMELCVFRDRNETMLADIEFLDQGDAQARLLNARMEGAVINNYRITTNGELRLATTLEARVTA